jgi:alpha-galactosidase
VLRIRPSVRNDGAEPYDLQELACVLPVPDVARELFDLNGRWLRERHPAAAGLPARLVRPRAAAGRTGHDAEPLLAAARRLRNRTGR